MIKLPCNATFGISLHRSAFPAYDGKKYHDIIVKDSLDFAEYLKIEEDEGDGHYYNNVLNVSLEESSLWPIIRELERYAKENNIMETTNETK